MFKKTIYKIPMPKRHLENEFKGLRFNRRRKDKKKKGREKNRDGVCFCWIFPLKKMLEKIGTDWVERR